ncbi:MAG: hypothetical protein ACFFF9_07265 [Candidatus Thorarchaeota archaeon]
MTKDYKAAIKLCREILIKEPNNVGAIHNLKFALHDLGEAKAWIECAFCRRTLETDIYPTNIPRDQIQKAVFAIKYAEIPETVRVVYCPDCDRNTPVTFILCIKCREGYLKHYYTFLGVNKETKQETFMERIFRCEKCNYRSTLAEEKSPAELRVYEGLLQVRPEIREMIEVLFQQEEMHGKMRSKSE